MGCKLCYWNALVLWECILRLLSKIVMPTFLRDCTVICHIFFSPALISQWGDGCDLGCTLLSLGNSDAPEAWPGLYEYVPQKVPQNLLQYSLQTNWYAKGNTEANVSLSHHAPIFCHWVLPHF